MAVRMFIVAWVMAIVSVHADTLTLRDTAYVKGPRIVVGDIARVDGPNADAIRRIEITRAALPGSSKRINAALVETRLRGAGYDDDVRVDGASQVMAETMHLEVTPGMLAEDLRAYVHREMPWEPDAALVEITPGSRELQVPDGDIEIVWRPNPTYNYLGSGTFSGEVLVDGVPAENIAARATVQAFDHVVVASKPIQRGDRIGRANVHLERRDLSTLRPGAFFSLDDVRGLVAKASIQPGRVVENRRVALPILAKRNQSVAVEIVRGSLVITGRARALEGAAAGDLIECENLHSGERFVGVMRPDGVVQVD